MSIIKRCNSCNARLMPFVCRRLCKKCIRRIWTHEARCKQFAAHRELIELGVFKERE